MTEPAAPATLCQVFQATVVGDTALTMTNRPEFHLADTTAFHLG